jgi:hypothetical protein
VGDHAPLMDGFLKLNLQAFLARIASVAASPVQAL